MTSAVPKPIALAALLLLASGAATAQPSIAPTYTNALGMKFVLIPAGSYTMGSAPGDGNAAANEKPAHRVTITKSFYLARLELTQAQWEAVMGSNPYTLDRSNPYYNLPGMAARITRPNHPATVSWNDAQDFIDRLNRRSQHWRRLALRVPSRLCIRLPWNQHRPALGA